MTFQNTYSPTSSLFYNNQLLLEVKEYIFLGNIINFKGSFKTSIQELTKRDWKSLFALKSRFSNFQTLSVNLLCKLCDILIWPVVLYNCEVWFPEEYLPVLRATDRANRNRTICDLLSFEEKKSYEQVHNKNCKAILGINKSACNIAAKSELGRFPTDSFIKTKMLMYFCRLNTDDINPLLNTKLNNEGIHTWYTVAFKIFDECEMDSGEYEILDRPFNKIKQSLKLKFRKTVSEKYTSRTLQKLSNINNYSKLFLYSQLKTQIKLEEYLLKETTFKNR